VEESRHGRAKTLHGELGYGHADLGDHVSRGSGGSVWDGRSSNVRMARASNPCLPVDMRVGKPVWCGREKVKNQEWKLYSSRSGVSAFTELRVMLEKLLVVKAISRTTRKHEKIATM
jgi:hypothetical protein